jgi:hypothetical protein
MPIPLQYASPSVRSGHSLAGIVSLTLAILSFALLAASIVSWAPVAKTGNGARIYEPSIVSLLCLAFAGICLISGLACGVVGMRQQRRKRAWAIAGLLANAIALVMASGILG